MDIVLTEKQWEFLGQLVLLAIGAIITIFLVPYFTNKYDEKQRKREQDREERQKTIDRNREDRKQQLEIQHELIERIMRMYTKAVLVGIGYSLKIGGNVQKFDFNYISDIPVELLSLYPLFDIYYKDNPEIEKEWQRIGRLTMSLLDYANHVEGDDLDNDLQELLKNSNSELSFEEAKKIIEETGFRNFMKKSGLSPNRIIELIRTTMPKIN